MEFFNSAKTVKLKGHRGKYLVACDDKEKVMQSRIDSSTNARWAVEFVKGKRDVVRLKSCHCRYLTASDELFLLGMTGQKVIQSATVTSAVEWRPVTEGSAVTLVTAGGKLLRANWRAPPWLNSVTHNAPYRNKPRDRYLWMVEVVDKLATTARQRQNATDRVQGQNCAEGDDNVSAFESAVQEGVSEFESVVQERVDATISYENAENEVEHEEEEDDDDDDDDDD